MGAISLNIATTNPSCGYNNGSVQISATGGTPPYIFSLSGSIQNNGYFPGLNAAGNGIYNVLVTDATGQTANSQINLVNDLPPPVLNIGNVIRPSTCTSADGAITLSGSDGIPPYKYSIDGVSFSSSNTFSNLTGGSYTFFIQDANGCIAKNGYGFIGEFTALNNCGLFCNGEGGLTACRNDGSLDIVAEGGVTPYLYSIDGINFQTSPFNNNSNTYSNLPSGLYHLYVKDAAGTTVVAGYQLIQSCVISITYIGVDASCGQNDGSISISANNGNPPYLYTIDGVNFQTSNVFQGLSSGTYSVAVKDAQGIINSRQVVVFNKCPTVAVTGSDETCSQRNGTITAIGSKGSTPYQYSIDGINFQSNGVFTGLVAGYYSVTIKDANGFTSSASITINNNCLQIGTSITNTVCGGPNGSLTVTANGGIPPYQYSIDGINYQSSNVFTGLSNGIYSVTIKDANGAVKSATVNISGIPGPALTVATTFASCNKSDGSITINAQSGVPPFQYSSDGINFQGSNIFNNLSVGTYQCTVKDANGCTAALPVSISLDCPTLAVAVTDETCGKGNGGILISVSNGQGPYTYSINGTFFQAGNQFGGLSSGNYTITIKDANGITAFSEVVVKNDCPKVTATEVDGVCGNSNATISAVGSGGTPPYLYSIDGTNFQSSSYFTQLPTGNYIITIRDGQGLTNTTTVKVNNFPGPNVAAISKFASCANNDGSIIISGVNGTPPFMFGIENDNFQPNNDFGNLSSGTYIAKVKDVNGCIGMTQVIVPLENNLTINVANNPTICQGAGMILPVLSNAKNYSWFPISGLDNPLSPTPVASPKTTTKYYLTATTGPCMLKDSITVFVNSAPVPDAGINTTICFGKSTQLNGNGGVRYAWTPSTYLDNPFIASPIVTRPSGTITYTLTVTNINGCTSLQPAEVTITVTPPAKVFIGNDTSVVINQSLQLSAIDINNSGFTKYEWSPSFGLNDALLQSPIAVITRNITYTVIASTIDGCAGTDSISIKVYPFSDIFVPTAFTPNNDGRNDVLKVIPIGVRTIKYFTIYNRWGQRIFFSDNPSAGWDGTISGKQQDSGTYVWMAAGIDYNGNIIQRKGTVVLIR